MSVSRSRELSGNSLHCIQVFTCQLDKVLIFLFCVVVSACNGSSMSLLLLPLLQAYRFGRIVRPYL